MPYIEQKKTDFKRLEGGNFMSKFKDFQNEIKEINNVWNSENVFFTQMRDGYSASYTPKYP